MTLKLFAPQVIDITPKYPHCIKCGRQMKYHKDNKVCLDCDTGK